MISSLGAGILIGAVFVQLGYVKAIAGIGLFLVVLGSAVRAA